MNKITKYIVGIVLIAGIVFVVARDRKLATKDNSGEPGKQEQSSPDSATQVEGVLQISDSKARGNLMIVREGQTNPKIYLTTRRDFSALLGKTVIMTFDGTINSFALNDIVAK